MFNSSLFAVEVVCCVNDALRRAPHETLGVGESEMCSAAVLVVTFWEHGSHAVLLLRTAEIRALARHMDADKVVGVAVSVTGCHCRTTCVWLLSSCAESCLQSLGSFLFLFYGQTCE